ncbi:hypothetical protein Tco_1262933 [Tanacetum coccineum]
MERQRDRNRDISDDEDRYRRRSDADRYRSEHGGQDRRISNRSDEEDKDGANEKRRDKNKDKGTDGKDDMRCGMRHLRYRDDTWILWDVGQQRLYKPSAGKTWYGMLRDSVMAFEVVVRFHGYGGEINPIGEL